MATCPPAQPRDLCSGGINGYNNDRTINLIIIHSSGHGNTILEKFIKMCQVLTLEQPHHLKVRYRVSLLSECGECDWMLLVTRLTITQAQGKSILNPVNTLMTPSELER
jgi:hypothetical protein